VANNKCLNFMTSIIYFKWFYCCWLYRKKR